MNVHGNFQRSSELEKQIEKMQSLPTKFKIYFAAFNEEGLAVHGFQNGKYLLYWASPLENRVKRVESSTETDVDYKKEGRITIISKDHSITLVCNFFAENDTYYLLNGKRAVKITPTPQYPLLATFHPTF